MRLSTIVAIIVLAVTVVSANAADWPYWRGPEHNDIAPDTGINKDWGARSPRELWRAAMHDGGYAGPSVADGKVFIIDHEGAEDVLRAISLATGEDVWAARYADLAKANYGFSRATPVYDDGRIYTVSFLGRVTCFDAADGTELWSVDMRRQFAGTLPTWGWATSPLIDGDKIIVVPGGPEACVAALNKQSGETIWTGGGSDIPGYATPVKATIQGIEQYVVFAGKAPIGVRADNGQLLWRHPWETAYDVNAATPIVSGDHIFITSNYNRGCAVIAIEAAGPRVVWENKNIAAHFNAPVFMGGLLFGTNNTNLVCLNPSNGQVVWSAPGFERGGVVGVDGVVIAVGGATGAVAMLDASPELRELGRFTPLGGQSWTPPIIADGKLILRNKETLACYDLM